MYEPLKLSGRLGHGTEKTTGLPVTRELDVNALNFCRFAIASLPSTDFGTPGSNGEKGKAKEKEGVLVVPSLLDSELVSRYILSVYNLPMGNVDRDARRTYTISQV